ncbi:hypothetical protein V6Z77_010207 [Aspergillus fumigatus]
MARSRVGGSMWKARAASPLVACELCAGHFFLPGRPPLCDWWRTGSLSWASLQERGSRPSQPWFLLSSGRRAASLVGSSRLSTGFGASSNGAPVTPETCDGRRSRGRLVQGLKTPGSSHRWDD